MEAKTIRTYLSKVPAVLCTAGSYIATKNAEARKRLPWIFEGGSLFERMSPENVLKYEAHFASFRARDAFLFTVNASDGPWLALAAFDSICERRFAAVSFFKSREELEVELSREWTDPTREEMADFAAALLGIDDECFEPSDKRGLIDLKKLTQELISRMEGMGISLSYSENGEAERALCIPEDIPTVSYLQMVMMMVLTASSVGCGSAVSVKLCKYGENTEVAVIADYYDDFSKIQNCGDLSHSFPAVSSYISVCGYIAGLLGCTLELRKDSADRLSLVLVIGERSMFDVDFKSRDHLLYFDEELEFSLEYIMRLCSGDTKQEGEDKDGFNSCHIVL